MTETTTELEGAVSFDAVYAYDAVGNRLSRNLGNGADITTYVYDSNDRLASETTTGNTVTYTYDANGNTLARDDGALTTYAYDFENQLINIATPTDNATYRYDVDGIRVGQVVNGSATNFLVDRNRPFAQVLAEFNSSATFLADRSSATLYVYGKNRISQGV